MYLYRVSLVKYTGWCQNDFNVQGYGRRRAALELGLPAGDGPALDALDVEAGVCQSQAVGGQAVGTPWS